MRLIAPLLALTVILLGGAMTVIEWHKQAAYGLTVKLNRGIPVDSADLMAEIEAQKTLAAMGRKDADMLKMTSLAEYSLARAVPALSQERSAFLSDAETHASEGLMLAPADSTVWLRLARIRQLAGKSDRDILQPLIMSVQTGPTLSALMASRVKLALIYKDSLQPEEKQLFANQFIMLQQWKTEEANKLVALQGQNPFQ